MKKPFSWREFQQKYVEQISSLAEICLSSMIQMKGMHLVPDSA